MWKYTEVQEYIQIENSSFYTAFILTKWRKRGGGGRIN